MQNLAIAGDSVRHGTGLSNNINIGPRRVRASFLDEALIRTRHPFRLEASLDRDQHFAWVSHALEFTRTDDPTENLCALQGVLTPPDQCGRAIC